MLVRSGYVAGAVTVNGPSLPPYVPTDKPPGLDELVHDLRRVLRAGLPITPALEIPALLALRGVWAQLLEKGYVMSNMTVFGSGIGGELDRPARSTKRALEQVHAHGLVAAGKVDAAAYVAGVAMQEIGILSMDEALVVERCPHAAGRAKVIVDNFTAIAAGVVSHMGR